MKTPEDFARVINDRKADSSWKAKPKMPAVIIITMVFATIMLGLAGSGLLSLTLVATRFLNGGGSFLAVATALGMSMGITILATALAAVTLFACVRRPTWGRVVSMVFAATFGTLIVVALVFPDPHPLIPIAPGAEQAGAYAGDALMIFGMVAYLWSMVRGAKASAYFASA